MKIKYHSPGDSVPNGAKWFYVVEHGHFVRKVDMSLHFRFPELENPNMRYVTAG